MSHVRLVESVCEQGSSLLQDGRSADIEQYITETQLKFANIVRATKVHFFGFRALNIVSITSSMH